MSLFTLICFGLLTSLLYYLFPKQLRWVWLLLISYAFYAYSGASALPFILLTTLSTWGGALLIGRIGDAAKARIKAEKATLSAEEKKQIKAQAKQRQRLLFWATLLLNFGVLAVLKYSDGFLALAGASPLGLVLPLGISFYTFQSTGYLIDVYNGKYAPERSPLRFALFVSFFPQLIQGPIGRYDQLAPQLSEPHDFDLESYERGALLILWGFFKKKVIADRALPVVERVFSNSGAYGGAIIIFAVLFYSLQQYCDFSGGIDLVAGIAELFGIRLAPNFKRPYFAVSLGDFWRRWHISLGAWMRDYVFYPFALTKPMSKLSKALKKRVGTDFSRAFPAAIGNILVFFLVGIWHGATMNYVLWGLYNGIILAISALMEPTFKRFHSVHPDLAAKKSWHLFTILRTFLIVNIGWYFDRSATAANAFSMLARTFTDFRPAQLTNGTLLTFSIFQFDYKVLAIGTAILFGVSLAQERGVNVRSWLLRQKLPIRWGLLILFIVSVVATFVSEGGTSSFVYAVF